MDKNTLNVDIKYMYNNHLSSYKGKITGNGTPKTQIKALVVSGYKCTFMSYVIVKKWSVTWMSK